MRYLQPRDDAPSPTESAVIAHVAAADPLVGAHRLRLDPAATWGVPAHVTVLYPFVAPAAIDETVIATLAAAAGRVDAFECAFARTRWFGEDVVWLAPDPTEPFQRLTQAVCAAFSEYPPYGGAFDDVIPHLTIGERRAADVSALREAERAVQPRLPMTATIDRLLVIAGTRSPQSWRVVSEVLLGSEPPRSIDRTVPRG